MKIFFISENYFPNVSGVPVVVRYLAEGLVKKGHEVHVLTTRFEDCPNYEQVGGVCVHRFDIYKNFWHQAKGDIDSYLTFVKGCEADILVLECSQCITTDLLLPHIEKLPGKKVFHSHGFSGLLVPFFSIKPSLVHTLGTTYNWFSSQIYFKSTLKKALKHFDTSLCLSSVDNSKDYLEMYCVSCHILDNAADDMFFEEVKDGAVGKYVSLANTRYMVSCANYSYIKNQKDILLQYYHSHSSKDTSLVCIGSQKNSYYEECLTLKKELERKVGKRDVHLLYGVDRNDIPSILKGASLYLVTSRCEQYSISIIEAMSQGVPFVSTDVGNAKVLPGGITVKRVSDMLSEIDNLLADNMKYRELSMNGREFAFDNCRISAVVDRLNDIFEKL